MYKACKNSQIKNGLLKTRQKKHACSGPTCNYTLLLTSENASNCFIIIITCIYLSLLGYDLTKLNNIFTTSWVRMDLSTNWLLSVDE